MWTNFSPFIAPLAFVFGALIVGLISKMIILKKIAKIASKTNWRGDDILIAALKRWIVWWFLFAGAFLATLSMPVEAGLLKLIHNVIMVMAILSLTVFAANMSVSFIDLYSENLKESLPRTTIFTNLTRIFVFLIGILIIFNSLGISIAPILTGLGIGGLAVALALQETLANLFAGLQLIASKQIRPGDYIRLGSGEEGFIVDINWRNTTVRELSNNMNIIPNSHISKTIVKNYYLPEKISSVLVQVGVAYESDLEKVEKVTIEVAGEVMREIPGGVSDFEPFTRYHTFGDSSINFTVILKAKEFVDQYILKHEFIKRLHKRYQAEGITIPFPIRTLHFEGRMPESVLKDTE
ncbi:MAG TPA: mechanosensitive ion channel family protein [Patescibacteria group bacterium]|nr:mechanosensitive ion channel family protein [Patescibacteria group bacterium]